jgi:hypothetical protein
MGSHPKADPELVEVFDTEQESEALVVHGLLTSAGIDSIVTSLEAQQSVFPGVGGIVVRVNPAQAEEARRVIEEYKNAPEIEEEEEVPGEDEPPPAE